VPGSHDQTAGEAFRKMGGRGRRGRFYRRPLLQRTFAIFNALILWGFEQRCKTTICATLLTHQLMNGGTEQQSKPLFRSRIPRSIKL
jgi:hypothetical protein